MKRIILIEKFSSNDHRAEYYVNLAKKLDITWYLHDGDLRSCYNDKHSFGISLEGIRRDNPESTHLMVVSSGYRMLSSITGEVCQWLSQLDCWEHKFLLTPIQRPNWGRREMELKTVFHLLPASVQSLDYIKQNGNYGRRFEDLPDYVQEEGYYPANFTLENMETCFPDDIVKWVKAIPNGELDYQNTLAIGEKVLGRTVTNQDIQWLIKIPQFIDGELARISF